MRRPDAAVWESRGVLSWSLIISCVRLGNMDQSQGPETKKDESERKTAAHVWVPKYGHNYSVFWWSP
jgi:hypothetical protein